MLSSAKTAKINLRNWTVCRHSVCNAVAEQYPGYTSEEIMSDTHILSVELMMRILCSKEMVRIQSGGMLTCIKRTLLNFYYVSTDCITSKNVLSVVVRLGQRTYHYLCYSCVHRRSWHCFLELHALSDPSYIEYDNLLVFSVLYCITCKQRKEAFVVILQ